MLHGVGRVIEMAAHQIPGPVKPFQSPRGFASQETRERAPVPFCPRSENSRPASEELNSGLSLRFAGV